MLQNLLEQLRSAGTGSKVIAGLVVVSVIAIMATAAVVSNKPHFELVYSELSASENALIQKALAEAGIPFEQTMPPGPFMIYVDRAKKYDALMAVALSGALDKAPGGISSASSGISNVFMSAAERQQSTNKRQLEEMELLLENLDFVLKASVTTGTEASTPFGVGARKTGSVMLSLRRSETLSKGQSQTVASLVQFGLAIKPSDLTIADQSGNSLYDGASLEDGGSGSSNWLDQKLQYEQDLEDRANMVLTKIFGEGHAYVTVISDWANELTTTVAETADPEKSVALSQTITKSSTPSGASSGVGGPAGPGSNVGEFGVDSAAVPGGGSGEETDAVATADDTTTTFFVPRETKRTVNLTPTLKRLSIALYIDEGLADKKSILEENVKQSVGFSEERKDGFSSSVIPFTSLLPVEAVEGADGEGTDGGAAAEGEEAPSEPSPMVEMLLERGVEILSAVAFLFILMKSLKGASKGEAPPETTAEAVGALSEDEEMLERLAQAQIDELVKSDPERVGRILTAWAGNEKAA
ncbi:MAG: flagellar biosynthesis/type III secretory pathway M-ring protein FliF/YscJ [Planctomycetota bacterium]|jgi:flagellar biosynthesis/type III secretory pathway M-ring protein FliF/YscJ